MIDLISLDKEGVLSLEDMEALEAVKEASIGIPELGPLRILVFGEPVPVWKLPNFNR